MNWLKFSAQKNLNERLKDIIRNNGFMQKMFQYNSVPMDRIDNYLIFEIKDLRGKKAQSDSKKIILDKNLFENGVVSSDSEHCLIHELYHWIKRQKERAFYLADPEEVEAFILGITYEILRGVPKEKIAEIYYPIIKDHFDKTQDAKKMFSALLLSAMDRVKQYRGDLK